MAEPILYDNMEKALTKLNLSVTSNDINIELSKEFLVELEKNIYHGTYNEDVVDHIAKNGGLVREMEKSPLRRNLLKNSSVDSILNHTMEKMKYWTKERTGGLIHLNSYQTYVDNCISSNNELKESKYENPSNTTTDLDEVSSSLFNEDEVERGFGILPSSTEANPRDQVKSISTTIEAYSYPIRCIGSSYYAVSTGQNRTLIALVDLGASVSIMPLSTYLNLGLGELAHTKLTIELADRTVKYPKGIAENVLITLRVREERIVFTSVKLTSSLIKRVYMLSLRERMELDLEARLMGETLVLNRSLDLFFEDYIELNDLNEPFELKRNQGDDLIPTIEEGEAIRRIHAHDTATSMKEKKSTKLVEVSTKSGSVGVLKPQDGCSTRILAKSTQHGESIEQISREFLILILFNSRI
ncbi:putative reverse transcriptase domain-containing protein [Tanacetum coccineum]